MTLKLTQIQGLSWSGVKKEDKNKGRQGNTKLGLEFSCLPFYLYKIKK